MNKVALYIRLSKEDTDKALLNKDESESITNQRLLLTDYALNHDMYIHDTYTDEDLSGLYDDRPNFVRMMKDAKLGKFNIIVCKSQSRFSRNASDFERYIHELKLLGIRFISIVDNIDTDVKATNKTRQINGLVNEWYCEDISESIKAVFTQKMKDGQSLTPYAPFGYIKSTTNKYEWLIDEYASEIVIRIYTLFLDGYSVGAIAKILDDDKVLTPTMHKKRQGLNYSNYKIKFENWSQNTIKRILTNETYTGKLIQHTIEKISYKSKKTKAVDKDKWIITENHHEAIIPQEMYDRVQQLRSTRRVTSKTDRQKPHIFAGKLKCADCGHTIIKIGGVRNDPNDRYMKCQLHNISRGKKCTGKNIKYSTIYNTVLDDIKSLTNESNREEVLKHFANKNIVDKKFDKAKKEKSKLEQEIKQAQESLFLLYQDRTKKIIDENMFLIMKSKMDEEYNSKVSRLTKLEKELETHVDIKIDIEQLLDKYTNTKTLNIDVINDLIDRIEVGKNKEESQPHITIYYKF